MMSPPWKAEKRPMTRSSSGGFFFGCFRPVVADRDDRLVRSRSTPLKGRDAERAALAYIAFDDDGKGVDALQRGCRAEVADRPPKEGTTKRHVRATKAAFLEMSLVRKVRKKRNFKKMEEPNGRLRKKADRILRLMSERSAGRNDSWEEPGKSDFDVLTSSRSSIAATSLSCTGSASSLSPGSSSNSLDCGSSKLRARRASSNKPKQTGQGKPLLLILLALALLIFWGKVCAIVCTSVCLVLSLSSLARAHQSATCDVESSHSADYKKRVIMEGLLSRQQRPRGPQRWPSSSSSS